MSNFQTETLPPQKKITGKPQCTIMKEVLIRYKY